MHAAPAVRGERHEVRRIDVHDADPDNVGYINSRGIAYSSKGDDEHALADYALCLQMRPNFASAYNNRGIILLRKLDFQHALEEFNAAVKYGPTSPSRSNAKPEPCADVRFLEASRWLARWAKRRLRAQKRHTLAFLPGSRACYCGLATTSGLCVTTMCPWLLLSG